MMIIYRKATTDDIVQIIPLWRELMDTHAQLEPMFKAVVNAEEKFAQYLEEILGRENFFVCIALSDGEVIGYLIASLSIQPEVFEFKRRAYIQDTLVKKDYRKQGIGRQLMDLVREFALAQKADRIDLLVADKNESGKAFWAEMGFAHTLTTMTIYLT